MHICGCTHTCERLLPNSCSSGKAIQGKISVALPAQAQRDCSPNKHGWWWPIFHSVQYEMANFNTVCQKFKVLLINLEIQYSQNTMDLDADCSCPLPPVVSCSVSKTQHNFQDRNIKMMLDVRWCCVFHQLTGNSPWPSLGSQISKTNLTTV